MPIDDLANNGSQSLFMIGEGEIRPRHWVKSSLSYQIVARPWTVESEWDGTLVLVRLATVDPTRDLTLFYTVLDRRKLVTGHMISDYDPGLRKSFNSRMLPRISSVHMGRELGRELTGLEFDDQRESA